MPIPHCFDLLLRVPGLRARRELPRDLAAGVTLPAAAPHLDALQVLVRRDVALEAAALERAGVLAVLRPVLVEVDALVALHDAALVVPLRIERGRVLRAADRMRDVLVDRHHLRA